MCTMYNILISSCLNPLTLMVVGAPQMTLQQYLSTFPCLPLPSGNLETPFLSTSHPSSVFLSFLLLSLYNVHLLMIPERVCIERKKGKLSLTAYLEITTVVVVPCGGPKSLPAHRYSDVISSPEPKAHKVSL